ncbi:MAG TPA: cell division protein ZipA C-terminal FtsZ-binding domain-containing protein, partial [Rhodocyclaceae bacterium]|nr:cell division protein ZipA C-terminal FtsZ-binding domain-containing protein [Rhodocyclaceae bacterium]
MNDLQIALLSVGGALVVGVWGHGKWQEIRQRKLAEKLLNPDGGDPLMEKKPAKAAAAKTAPRPALPVADRREPVIATESDDDDLPAADHAPEPVMPRHDPAPAAPKIAPPRPTDIGEPTTELLSSEADFIARLALPEIVGGEQLLAIPRDALALLRKRVAWVGFDEAKARWELIQPAGRYRELRIGMQLADRSGPINATLVDQFRKAVERIADELTAVPEVPPAREAVARAINLDRLGAEVDIQLAVHLAPRHDHFSPDVVRDTALEKGFRLASDGVLAYHDAAGDRLFILQMPDARAPDGLPPPTACCILEVPCIAHGDRAFDRMMVVAQELAEALDALLVDEHRRPVTERVVA